MFFTRWGSKQLGRMRNTSTFFVFVHQQLNISYEPNYAKSQLLKRGVTFETVL